MPGPFIVRKPYLLSQPGVSLSGILDRSPGVTSAAPAPAPSPPPPPPPPPGPALDVLFLGRFEGADGSNVMVDSSTYGRSVDADETTVSTSEKKFGGSSLNTTAGSVPGAGGGVFLSPGPEIYAYRTLTVEMWVKNVIPANLSDGPRRIFAWITNFWRIYVRLAAVGEYDDVDGIVFEFSGGSGGSYSFHSTGVFFSGAWQHFAFCIDEVSGNLTVFLDGIKIYEAPQNLAQSESATGMTIGQPYANNANKGLSAYYDEVRVIGGTALYSDDFAVPAAQFPTP